MILVVSLAVVAFVLSLGLHLGWLHPGRSIQLPFTLVARIPLWLNNLLPARLSIVRGTVRRRGYRTWNRRPPDTYQPS